MLHGIIKIRVGEGTKIQNPHDKVFKESFSNLLAARDFKKNYLPQNLMQIVILGTLEPQKDSFTKRREKHCH